MTEDLMGRTGLRVEQRTYSIADLGPDSALPMVGAPLETPYRITSDLPQEILEGSLYGNPANLYPYQAQDGYGRAVSERSLQTVVLENERLRAVFLPELGGRLWELFDKVSGKHLLHTQSRIQFANLALRGAWFAGGIEWNIGTRGHSPTTCSPLHTSILSTSEGYDVLRMWEFDRLRQVVFQVDAWLPDESPVLLVSIRIRNPNDHEVPMYWWTNASVPEDAESRVIVPATSAFASNYSDIVRVNPTEHEGIDCTWPAANLHAADFFFDLEPNRRRWIVNADGDGDGLAMISTDRLRGRKLFVWGRGAGGQRWQKWLTPESGPYAEIQAGLAQTQLQHLPMPAGAEWTWTEAYGNPGVDAATAHGKDWDSAVAHCESRLAALIANETLEEAHRAAVARMDLPPQRSLILGSGWGAVESERRKCSGRSWVQEAGTPFSSDSVTGQEQPWLDLLRGAGFSGAETFVSGEDWEKLLEAASPGAQSFLHRALIKHGSGELEPSRQLYLDSLRLKETAQARRGLALLALADREGAEAREHYRSACSLEPGNTSLLVEAATACLDTGAADEALLLLDRAPVPPGQLDRVRFLRALAFARTGESERAAAILKGGLQIADLREGDTSLSILWREVFPEEDLPADYDFSMT